MDVSESEIKAIRNLESMQGSKILFTKMVTAFRRFCVERQRRWQWRRDGLPDQGSDLVFIHKKFTNLSRELDRGTQYLRKELIPILTAAEPKIGALPAVLFKSCVYRLMNKVETFQVKLS